MDCDASSVEAAATVAVMLVLFDQALGSCPGVVMVSVGCVASMTYGPVVTTVLHRPATSRTRTCAQYVPSDRLDFENVVLPVKLVGASVPGSVASELSMDHVYPLTPLPVLSLAVRFIVIVVFAAATLIWWLVDVSVAVGGAISTMKGADVVTVLEFPVVSNARAFTTQSPSALNAGHVIVVVFDA